MQSSETLKIVIVGHVDHGKSTLIGRLFYDSGCIPESRYREIEATCRAQGREFEFAYLMDALEEEREQNITIDTASTYFATASRSYEIIDAPGHKQFLKNMITGAASADAAILLVDGGEGVREQTRRHAYVLSLLGIKQVVVAVNKLDRIGYDQRTFRSVESDICSFLHNVGLVPTGVIPISARDGENIAQRQGHTRWYEGPTILEALDAFVRIRDDGNLPLRLPVQDVYKWDDRRLYVGRVESGRIRTGDSIVFLPSGAVSRVRSVEQWLAPELGQGLAGDCVGFTTEDELFIERGELLCHSQTPAGVGNELRASVFWLAPEHLKTGATVNLKLATAEVTATVAAIEERLDSSTLELRERHATELLPTEVGTVLFALKSPLAADLYSDNAALGRFVIETNLQIGGGGIVRAIDAERMAGVRTINIDERLFQDDEGSWVDLTQEPDKPIFSIGSYLLDFLTTGNKVLFKLRSPHQVEPLALIAYEHNLYLEFSRHRSGAALFLSRMSPAKIADPEFTVSP
ncbi:MAG: GTP-binding protein [Geobacter sp.]|nr:GTP-binding protein [Geobacter sp.]